MARTIKEFNELIDSIRAYLDFFENKAVEITAFQRDLRPFINFENRGFFRGNIVRKIKNKLINIRKIVKIIYQNNEEFSGKIINLKSSINRIQIRKYSKSFSDLSKRRKIIINFLVKLYSKKGEVWQNRNNPKEIISTINNTREGGILPFIAIIKSHRELLTKIERDIDDATFNFNLDVIMESVNAPLNQTTILIDSDFLTHADKFAIRKRKLLRLINHGRIEITREVLNEIKKVSGGSPLIGQDLRSQILSMSTIIDVNINTTNEKIIIDAWLKYAPKARNELVNKFKKSGDYKIMLRALQLSPSPVIILGNDTDIYQPIRGLHNNRKFLNITVHSFEKDGSVNNVA
jgi:hypothetical protein